MYKEGEKITAVFCLCASHRLWATEGDCGMLGTDAAPSPLMISCMDASRASTLVDICIIRSRIWVDMSSNFVSSCSKRCSTNAVSSCGLEMSLAGGLAPAGAGRVAPPGEDELGDGRDGVTEGVTLRGRAEDAGGMAAGG